MTFCKYLKDTVSYQAIYNRILKEPEFCFCLCPVEHMWLQRQLWRVQGEKSTLLFLVLAQIHQTVFWWPRSKTYIPSQFILHLVDPPVFFYRERFYLFSLSIPPTMKLYFAGKKRQEECWRFHVKPQIAPFTKCPLPTIRSVFRVQNRCF